MKKVTIKTPGKKVTVKVPRKSNYLTPRQKQRTA